MADKTYLTQCHWNVSPYSSCPKTAKLKKPGKWYCEEHEKAGGLGPEPATPVMNPFGLPFGWSP